MMIAKDMQTTILPHSIIFDKEVVMKRVWRIYYIFYSNTQGHLVEKQHYTSYSKH